MKDAIGKFNSCRKCAVWKEPPSPTTSISEAIFFAFQHRSVEEDVEEDVQELDMLIVVLRDINE